MTPLPQVSRAGVIWCSCLVRPYPRMKQKPHYIVVGADCSVHSIPVETPEETLRALIARNGEKVEWPALP